MGQSPPCNKKSLIKSLYKNVNLFKQKQNKRKNETKKKQEKTDKNKKANTYKYKSANCLTYRFQLNVKKYKFRIPCSTVFTNYVYEFD